MLVAVSRRSPGPDRVRNRCVTRVMTEHAESAADEFPEPSGAGRVDVVGTAHVSEHSVTEVESAIEESEPDIVAVELDEGGIVR